MQKKNFFFYLNTYKKSSNVSIYEKDNICVRKITFYPKKRYVKIIEKTTLKYVHSYLPYLWH